jgi:hypothetical protein
MDTRLFTSYTSAIFSSLPFLLQGRLIGSWKKLSLIVLAEALLLILFAVSMFIILQRKNKFSFAASWSLFIKKLDSMPSVFWVALGALPPYILFFVSPIFFSPENRVYYLVNYLPENRPIGRDLVLHLDALKNWFISGRTTSYIFTPVANLVFAPALFIGYPNFYYVLTVITLLCFLILFLLSLKISDQTNHAVIALITAATLFSYDMQFELERGQSYTLAFMLLLLSIYIFHKFPELRFFAYAIFTISVQLKYYPAFFIFAFVDDWQDWKANLKRFASLGAINFALLFIFGIQYYRAFYDHMIMTVTYPFIGEGIPTVNSFVPLLAQSGLGVFQGDALTWIQGHVSFIEFLLYFYFTACLLVVLAVAWLRNERGINLDLVAVLVIGKMLLTQSHDYTIPMLAFPLAILLGEWSKREYGWIKLVTILVIIIISFSFALTLPPYTVRYSYIKNSMPMLYVILTAITVLYAFQRKKALS